MRDRSLGKYPYEDSRALIEMTGGGMCDPDFDMSEFRALYEKYYPPKTEKEEELMQTICMGHNAPQELIEEVERERSNAT